MRREAVALMRTDNPQEVTNDFGHFIEENPVEGNIESTDKGLKITVIGKAAHGMEPEKGINAATYLAKFLNRYDFGGGAGRHGAVDGEGSCYLVGEHRGNGGSGAEVYLAIGAESG